MKRIIGILGLLGLVGTAHARPGAFFQPLDQPNNSTIHVVAPGNTAGGVLFAGVSGQELFLQARTGSAGTGTSFMAVTAWPVFNTSGGDISAMLNSGVARVFSGQYQGALMPTPGGQVQAANGRGGCALWYFPSNTIVRYNAGGEAWPIQDSCDHHYELMVWSTTWQTPEQPDGAPQVGIVPLIGQDAMNHEQVLGSMSCAHAFPFHVGVSSSIHYTMFDPNASSITFTAPGTTVWLCVLPDGYQNAQNFAVLTTTPTPTFHYAWVFGRNAWMTGGVNNGPRVCSHFTDLSQFALDGAGTDIDDAGVSFVPRGIGAVDSNTTHLCALKYPTAQVPADAFPASLLFTDVDSKIANRTHPASPGP